MEKFFIRQVTFTKLDIHYCAKQRYNIQTYWLYRITISISCQTNWAVKVKFLYGKHFYLTNIYIHEIWNALLSKAAYNLRRYCVNRTTTTYTLTVQNQNKNILIPFCAIKKSTCQRYYSFNLIVVKFFLVWFYVLIWRIKWL